MTQASVNMAGPLAADAMISFNRSEVLQRAQAIARALPKKAATPACEDAVYLGLFFDGTGNNRDNDLPRHAHSNVVRLWMAHRASQSGEGGPYYRPEYIPGVGTPFPEVGETKYTTLGKATAKGGQSRIYWALIQAINVMHRAVNFSAPLPALTDQNAGQLVQNYEAAPLSAAGAKVLLSPHIKSLTHILKSLKQKVSTLVLSVFGFSRGAAEARAFCNFFYGLCESDGRGGYLLAEVPVKINFLGIFDTVSSVGLVGADLLKIEGHQAWSSGALRIHPDIARCVHFVAAHEARSCFDLDSASYKGSYPANTTEVVYPGSHSDVGGGYAPRYQGRSARRGAENYNFLALAPCIHMYREAWLAGVQLKPFAELLKHEKPNFTPDPQLLADYNAYIAADEPPSSSTTKEILAQRMHRYRFYRFRKLSRYVADAVAQGAAKSDADYLNVSNNHFAERCHDLQRTYANTLKEWDKTNTFNHIKRQEAERNGTPFKGIPQLSKRDALEKAIIPEDLELWEGMHRSGEVPSAVEKLFDYYVHDSMAGFAQDGVDEYALNGRGILRRREVYDRGGE